MAALISYLFSPLFPSISFVNVTFHNKEVQFIPYILYRPTLTLWNAINIRRDEIILAEMCFMRMTTGYTFQSK
jgi:hypothetical protein